MDVLCTILESVLDRQRKSPSGGLVSGTSTPPPSPQHLSQGSGDQSAGHPAPSFTTSPVQQGSLLRAASHRLLGGRGRGGGGGGGEVVAVLAPFDSDSEEVSALALRCLAHLFTWIPLSSNINSHLLDVIFRFAALGAVPVTVSEGEEDRNMCFHVLCCTYYVYTGQEGSHGPDLRRSSLCHFNLGMLAMSAVNEITYRNCVPADFEGFLLHMFSNAYQLLQIVLCESPLSRDKARLTLLDEG